ncbi:L-serine ammonia-lyase, iron-sulfur-dependent, subunit alpha [Bacillota bacterium]
MSSKTELKELLVRTLKDEIEKSTGCTDPGATCLAAARAVLELGVTPEKIVITVSPNVYKNGVSVGVPGTGKRGLAIAAGLGCFIGHSETGLDILNYVTPEAIELANSMVAEGRVRVTYAEFPNPLYVRAEVFSGKETAAAVISGDYSNIVHVSRNGNTVMEKPVKEQEEAVGVLIPYKLKDFYDIIIESPADDFRFLLEYADINRAAAELGLTDEGMSYGKKLRSYESEYKEGAQRIAHDARTLTAAAGEARMLGLIVPIMAIAGSGNHGITNFLGTSVVAYDLNADEEHTIKALAISSMLTVYTKEYIKRMTAFCGCSVAAATGVSAAAVYLLGGTYEQGILAINSLVGTLGGMFCDGAKESCAYKLSTATMMAIQFAYMAVDDCGLPEGIGVVGNTIEDTFYNLGQLNNFGMRETDRMIVQLIERTEDQKR